ncbi:MAG: DUF2007 domain-containing protein [Ferruginibacter sp.]
METITLKTFDNYFTANIILTKLQDAGIECYLFDENTVTIGPLISGAIGGIKLVVSANDAQIAATVLQQFETEYLNAVPCPKCGAHEILLVVKPVTRNYLTAILTWFFSSYAVAPEKIYQCQHCGYESLDMPLNNKEDN